MPSAIRPEPPRTIPGGRAAGAEPSDATAEPLAAPAEKAERVRAMFDAIAGRYDLLNRVLSAGFDTAWRRDAVREAVAGAPAEVLDVATGTADLALGIKRARPSARVVGVDVSQPMLDVGRRKVARARLDVPLELGDATSLAYPDARFDVVAIAYGLRNVVDRDAALREFHRVLRPGGKLVILEFPPPSDGPVGRLFRAYFLRVLPAIGGLVSGNAGAYAYLPRSVIAFPDPHALALHMRRAGFVMVRYKMQSFGISALHVGMKAPPGPQTQEESREP